MGLGHRVRVCHGHNTRDPDRLRLGHRRGPDVGAVLDADRKPMSRATGVLLSPRLASPAHGRDGDIWDRRRCQFDRIGSQSEEIVISDERIASAAARELARGMEG